MFVIKPKTSEDTTTAMLMLNGQDVKFIVHEEEIQVSKSYKDDGSEEALNRCELEFISKFKFDTNYVCGLCKMKDGKGSGTTCNHLIFTTLL